MTIRDKIPGLDADALKTVRTNAMRLSASGTPKQKDQARDVLILIDEEEARRREALPPAPPKTRRKTGTDSPSKAGGKGRSSNVAT